MVIWWGGRRSNQDLDFEHACEDGILTISKMMVPQKKSKKSPGPDKIAGYTFWEEPALAGIQLLH